MRWKQLRVGSPMGQGRARRQGRGRIFQVRGYMFGSIQGARCAPRRFLTVAGCLLAALALLPTPASAALATGATITPSPADFGSVALGSTSVIEFSLTPDLGANYSVGTFGIVGVAPLQFHVLTGVGTTPCFVGFPAVGGDGTCNVTVQFAPTTPGLSSAQLVINDGASNSPPGDRPRAHPRFMCHPPLRLRPPARRAPWSPT